MSKQPPSAEALRIANCWVRPHVSSNMSESDAYSCAEDIDALCEQRVEAERERCAQIAHRHRPAVAGWALHATETIEREIRAPAERPAPDANWTRTPACNIQEDGFCATHQTANMAECANAKMRPAPEGPPTNECCENGNFGEPHECQKQEQPTQDTAEPGCGDAQRAVPMVPTVPNCMRPDGAEPCQGYHALLADRDRWWADNKRLGQALINTNAAVNELHEVIRERDEARAALAAANSRRLINHPKLPTPSDRAATGEQPGCGGQYHPQYRIEERDGGFEPQILYVAGVTGALVWFPLNAQGYWLEPDAYSLGNVRKHAPLPTRADAERALQRARMINSDQSIMLAAAPAPPNVAGGPSSTSKDWRAPGDTTSLTLYPDGPPAPPPAAVVDHTERARELGKRYIETNFSEADGDPIEIFVRLVEPALSAVASEHQAEIEALKHDIARYQAAASSEAAKAAWCEDQRRQAADAYQALLARLREPDVLEAVAQAIYETGPIGIRNYDNCRACAFTALTKITEMLK